MILPTLREKPMTVLVESGVQPQISHPTYVGTAVDHAVVLPTGLAEELRSLAQEAVRSLVVEAGIPAEDILCVRSARSADEGIVDIEAACITFCKGSLYEWTYVGMELDPVAGRRVEDSSLTCRIGKVACSDVEMLESKGSSSSKGEGDRYKYLLRRRMWRRRVYYMETTNANGGLPLDLVMMEAGLCLKEALLAGAQLQRCLVYRTVGVDQAMRISGDDSSLFECSIKQCLACELLLWLGAVLRLMRFQSTSSSFCQETTLRDDTTSSDPSTHLCHLRFTALKYQEGYSAA
jgi:hypothetical protein